MDMLLSVQNGNAGLQSSVYNFFIFIMTVRDLIISALRKGGVITKQEIPSASELHDGLEALNSLLESWSNESTLVYPIVTETFPLKEQSTFSIGAGQEFDTSPFLSIIATYITHKNSDYSLSSASEGFFSRIAEKNMSGISKFYHYVFGYPVATLHVWPKPQFGKAITLIGEKTLPSFGSLDDAVELPPGWKRALIYNLWHDLAPEYGQVISRDFVDIARKAKGEIARPIVKSHILDTFYRS